ncbi:MAG TPA: CHAD domain-containing protein [Ignavibacteria bacterium]|nr:CHAD domain-containing protein [Ignavibacteria bacterium]
MLKKKKQEKYFNRHWEAMFTHLYNFCVAENPEELHKLRVEIKKLEALFMLLKECSWNNYDDKRFRKKFMSVKKIFKNAGRIRNAHINLQLLDKFKTENSDFKDKQKTILQEQSSKFCNDMIFYADKISKNHKSLMKLLYDAESKKILDLYKKQLKKINKIFKSYKKPAELHKSRKNIKQLLYVYSILNKPFIKKIKLNAKYFDNLQEIIGKWHDTEITIDLLTSTGFSDSAVMNDLKKQSKDYIKKIDSNTVNFLKKAVL